MHKLFLILAAANGFIAVAFGAFGAHGLTGKIADNFLSAYETAVHYHFYHALALFGVALLLQRSGEKTVLMASGWAFVIGILLFSGSLYGLALGAPRWLGPITPIGGVALLLGWLLLLTSALRS
jgi:uncharacterized membrane protein YgdD (TMEM256/DUF423 family)